MTEGVQPGNALLRLYAARDHKALWARALPYTKYAIKRLIKSGRISKEQSTDDFFQECCLAAGEAARQWDPSRAEFSTWIVRRVTDRALNALRDAHNRDKHIAGEFDETLTPSEASVERSVQTRQDRVRVKRALEGLSPALKDVIERRYGIARPARSAKQIADEDGTHRNTVLRMLVLAQNQLATALEAN